MKRLLLFVFLFVSTAFPQQGRLIKNPLRELPVWARLAFTRQKLDSRFAITLERYPHLLKGDFNADNRRDVALQITDLAGGSQGIAIMHAPRPQAEQIRIVIIGAGVSSPEFPENLKAYPHWSILPNDEIDGTGLPRELKGDAIRLQKSDSSGAYIYWDGKKYQWQPFRRKTPR
ncbi:MAG TPA: hypothetical protein VMW43_07190 [Bacteroidota bacterium]|nr:hypothetical protein [Bacteroidota bacterium]